MKDIRVGDRFQDNDPRAKGCPPKVVDRIDGEYAYCITEGTGRRTRIRLYRLHRGGHGGYIYLGNEKEKEQS